MEVPTMKFNWKLKILGHNSKNVNYCRLVVSFSGALCFTKMQIKMYDTNCDKNALAIVKKQIVAATFYKILTRVATILF